MSLLYLSTALLTLSNLVTSSPVAKRALAYPVSTYSTKLVRNKATTQPSSRWLHKQTVGQVSIDSEFAGEAFLTNITFGSQIFPVIIDTGSSDTCKS